ncbi:MAG TPA: DUF4230 domain-containing protein [Brevefilum sp.]|nr:DUF4230 domain-containing protein [Brevefilum sp.]HOR18909.1 DUF4230 domain-containing protein [Brevefilum sp.]HPL70010.1 DUF4230 domain-containing protein [Brevefilum sp.]
MEEQKPEKKNVGIFLVILLVAVIGSTIFIIITINRTIESAMSPVQNVNNVLSTQVSQILHPTPTVIPDPATIIREVQSLARLETIQYSVQKVITAEVNQGVLGPLFGDKLLLVAHGYVIAGVDLADLSVNDLRLEDDVLYVYLPEAEVFVAALNNENSYIYDRTTGLFRKSDANLETAARRIAEQEIYNGAVEDGILDQAQLNTEIFLERLFNALGYLRVVYE